MNVIYKISNESVWCKATLEGLRDVLGRMTLKDTVEVRLECHHHNTFNESGIKTCKDCGKQLEVTSWRN